MNLLKYKQFVNEQLHEGIAPPGKEALDNADELYPLIKKALGSRVMPPKIVNIPQHGKVIISKFGDKQIAYSDPEQEAAGPDKSQYVYDFDADYTEPIYYDGNQKAFMDDVEYELMENLNEKANLKRSVNKLRSLGYDWDMVGDNDEITVKGQNPYDDGNEYTWYWDGENAWNETSMRGGVPSGGEWSKPVKDVDTFIELMDNGKLNDGGEWE